MRVHLSDGQLAVVLQACRRVARKRSFDATAYEDNCSICYLGVIEDLRDSPALTDLEQLKRIVYQLAERALSTWYRLRPGDAPRKQCELVLLEDICVQAQSEDQAGEPRVLSDDLRKAINRLQPEQRTIARWILDGHGYAQIAEWHGVSRQAIEQRWIVIIDQLRRLLLKGKTIRRPPTNHVTEEKREADRARRMSPAGRESVRRYLEHKRKMRREARSGIFVIGR